MQENYDLEVSMVYEDSIGVTLPQVHRQAPLIPLPELTLRKALVVNVTVKNPHLSINSKEMNILNFT